MEILGLCGSPRKNGNSSTLLHEVLKGAEHNGAKTSCINVCDLNINHCTHCDNCIQTGSCIFKDDMQFVLNKLSTCDILLIASPLHFANISSQLKVVVDRMQLLWVHKYVLHSKLLTPKNRQCIFISTSARNTNGIFDGALMTIKDFLTCADITLESSLCFTDLNDENDVFLRSEFLKICYDKGLALAQK